MSDDFSVEDVAAMREQGDFREFLRSRMRKGPASKKPPAWSPPPGHKPGAWPPGTRPSAAVNDEIPAAAWDRALADYRAWLLAGCPPTPTEPCPCAGCRRANATPEEPA